MVDPRFYDLSAPKSAAELARLGGAEEGAGGEEVMIRSPAPLAEAGPDQVTFCADHRFTEALKSTRAGAVFAPPDFAAFVPENVCALVSQAPQAGFAAAVGALVSLKNDETLAGVASDVCVGANPTIGHGAIIGAGAQIGDNVVIGPYAVIGPGVVLGDDCRIGPHCVVRCAVIGDRVTILSQSVIGEAGFGVAAGPTGPVDQPQIGIVEIADEVSIGAFTAVDRAAFGATSIGPKCKIDNLCQIAHNCRLGTGVVIAARAGLSGSVVVGDYVMMGGRVGIADHVTVGDHARLVASAAIMSDIPAGETWGGYPARPWDEVKRTLVASRRLVRHPKK